MVRGFRVQFVFERVLRLRPTFVLLTALLALPARADPANFQELCADFYAHIIRPFKAEWQRMLDETPWVKKKSEAFQRAWVAVRQWGKRVSDTKGLAAFFTKAQALRESQELLAYLMFHREHAFRVPGDSVFMAGIEKFLAEAKPFESPQTLLKNLENFLPEGHRSKTLRADLAAVFKPVTPVPSSMTEEKLRALVDSLRVTAEEAETLGPELARRLGAAAKSSQEGEALEHLLGPEPFSLYSPVDSPVRAGEAWGGFLSSSQKRMSLMEDFFFFPVSNVVNGVTKLGTELTMNRRLYPTPLHGISRTVELRLTRPMGPRLLKWSVDRLPEAEREVFRQTLEEHFPGGALDFSVPLRAVGTLGVVGALMFQYDDVFHASLEWRDRRRMDQFIRLDPRMRAVREQLDAGAIDAATARLQGQAMVDSDRALLKLIGDIEFPPEMKRILFLQHPYFKGENEFIVSVASGRLLQTLRPDHWRVKPDSILLQPERLSDLDWVDTIIGVHNEDFKRKLLLQLRASRSSGAIESLEEASKVPELVNMMKQMEGNAFVRTVRARAKAEHWSKELEVETLVRDITYRSNFARDKVIGVERLNRAPGFEGQVLTLKMAHDFLLRTASLRAKQEADAAAAYHPPKTPAPRKPLRAPSPK